MDLTAHYPGTQELGSREPTRVCEDWEEDSFSLGDTNAEAGSALPLQGACLSQLRYNLCKTLKRKNCWGFGI